MNRKVHVRFGGGPSEKCPNGQLAGSLPYYGRGLSHNGPQESYTELLEHVEAHGLPHEYLIPAAMSVQGLHDQIRDLN